jgi:hypothetical protein
VLDNYLPAEKLEPDNAELLVRIARQYRHLMSDTSTKSEKLRLGRSSLEYAQRAASLAPKSSEAQLSPAISYGKMLPFFGSKEQVDASPRIKQSVDRALLLDPKNDTAWHILGRWNRVLADMNVVKRMLATRFTLSSSDHERGGGDLLTGSQLIKPTNPLHRARPVAP